MNGIRQMARVPKKKGYAIVYYTTTMPPSPAVEALRRLQSRFLFPHLTLAHYVKKGEAHFAVFPAFTTVVCELSYQTKPVFFIKQPTFFGYKIWILHSLDFKGKAIISIHIL